MKECSLCDNVIPPVTKHLEGLVFKNKGDGKDFFICKPCVNKSIEESKKLNTELNKLIFDVHVENDTNCFCNVCFWKEHKMCKSCYKTKLNVCFYSLDLDRSDLIDDKCITCVEPLWNPRDLKLTKDQIRTNNFFKW